MSSSSFILPGIDDPARLDALDATQLLDSAPEDSYDRLTRLAAAIMGTPVAVVSLVDDRRQFFKSMFGASHPLSSQRGTPLSHSFCKHAVSTHEPFVVTDAPRDPRVRDNLAVSELGVRAYAGVPLEVPGGHAIGTLCVIDTKPREFEDEKLAVLRDLAQLVVTEIQLRSEFRRREAADTEVRRRQNVIELLESVTVTASRAESFEGALQEVINYTCARFGWRIGHAYSVSETGRIEATRAHRDDGRFERFWDVSRSTAFAAGVGLPGRVLADRRPIWMRDLAEPDERNPRWREARELGIHSGFAFPVVSGKSVVAVIEFFSADLIDQDEMLIEVAEYIGIQLGRVYERARLEQGLALYRELSEKIEQPLTELSEYLDDLSRLLTANDDERVRTFTMLATERVRKLRRLESSLIDRTNEMSKRGRTSETTDLTEIVNQLIERRKDAGIRYLAPAGPIPVSSAAAALRRLTEALLDTAINYSTGGRVPAVTISPEVGFVDVLIETGGQMTPGAVTALVARAHRPGSRASSPLAFDVQASRIVARSEILSVVSDAGEGTSIRLRIPSAAGPSG